MNQRGCLRGIGRPHSHRPPRGRPRHRGVMPLAVMPRWLRGSACWAGPLPGARRPLPPCRAPCADSSQPPRVSPRAGVPGLGSHTLQQHSTPPPLPNSHAQGLRHHTRSSCCQSHRPKECRDGQQSCWLKVFHRLCPYPTRTAIGFADALCDIIRLLTAHRVGCMIV